jgi:hypothetical protein
MSGEALSDLIDSVARAVLTAVGGNEDAADALATTIAGEITSRFLVVPLPAANEELASRAEIGSMFPGLFTNNPKGTQ